MSVRQYKCSECGLVAESDFRMVDQPHVKNLSPEPKATIAPDGSVVHTQNAVLRVITCGHWELVE